MSHMNHQRHMVLLVCEEVPPWFRRAFQLAVHATSFTPADKVAEGLWQEIREGFDAGDQALAEANYSKLDKDIAKNHGGSPR